MEKLPFIICQWLFNESAWPSERADESLKQWGDRMDWEQGVDPEGRGK